MDRDAGERERDVSLACGDYAELAEMIAKWQEEYDQIMPQIEEFCSRSICRALMHGSSAGAVQNRIHGK